MLPRQHPPIPCHPHKQRLHAAPHRRHNNLSDLQSNQKRKRKHDRSERAALVVRGGRKLEIEVGEQGAEVGDEGGGHGEHGGDEAVVDEGVDAAGFEEFEGRLGGGEVGRSVEGNVDEGVAVYESGIVSAWVGGKGRGIEIVEGRGREGGKDVLHGPINQTHDTTQEAERNRSTHIPLLRL